MLYEQIEMKGIMKCQLCEKCYKVHCAIASEIVY
jgi:hypothetical protein